MLAGCVNKALNWDGWGFAHRSGDRVPFLPAGKTPCTVLLDDQSTLRPLLQVHLHTSRMEEAKRRGHRGYSMVSAPDVRPTAGSVVDSIASTILPALVLTLNGTLTKAPVPSPRSIVASPLKSAPDASTPKVPWVTLPSIVMLRACPSAVRPDSTAWNTPEAAPFGSIKTPVPSSMPSRFIAPNAAPGPNKPWPVPVTDPESPAATTLVCVGANVANTRTIASTFTNCFIFFSFLSESGCCRLLAFRRRCRRRSW